MPRSSQETRRGAAPRGRGTLPPVLPAQLESLALELYGVVGQALGSYGLSRRDQRKLFERSSRLGKIPPASALHLNQIRPLGDLMTTWLEEAPYIDEAGKPKVLPISGRGATFQSLAKRFLPKQSLAEVVALAMRCANVGTLPGGKIALYGDTMVNLAQTVLHIKQIVGTCLHNVQSGPQDSSMGRTERIVSQVISAEEFKHFLKVIRPQLHDLCERADRLLTVKAGRKSAKPKSKAAAGIGIYVYYDGAVKHVRRRAGETES
jgi:hypothetical protein